MQQLKFDWAIRWGVSISFFMYLALSASSLHETALIVVVMGYAMSNALKRPAEGGYLPVRKGFILKMRAHPYLWWFPMLGFAIVVAGSIAILYYSEDATLASRTLSIVLPIILFYDVLMVRADHVDLPENAPHHSQPSQ